MRVAVLCRTPFIFSSPRMSKFRALHFQSFFSYSAAKKKRNNAQSLNNKSPAEFSLEDFQNLGSSKKELKPSDFLNPIKFFNSVLESNPNIKIEPELVNEKIHSFLTKLEENLEIFSQLNDLEAINKFSQSLRIPSEKFLVNLYLSSFTKFQQQKPLQQTNFFKLLTKQLLLSSDAVRSKFNELLPSLLEPQISKGHKSNFFVARANVSLLHQWLIFRAGYDLPLKFDPEKNKKTIDSFITPEFLQASNNSFHYLRRHFHALSLNEKVSVLNLYSALYHKTDSANEVRNLLKRVANSFAKNIEKLSTLQLVILTQVFVRSGYDCPAFWTALENYVLFRLETDFSVNYLIKYLQGFAHFRKGSTELYMEIDRFIGFHAEELTKSEILPLARIYSETGKGRHKLFSLLELKIMEFKHQFSLEEAVDLLHCFASMNYLTPRLFVVFETKIIDQRNSLNENMLLKVVDSLRMAKKTSPLFELVKPIIQEILTKTDSENFLICIIATYLEELGSLKWYEEVVKKIKVFLDQKSPNFLLKLGGQLVRVSNRLFDEDVYKLFEGKCKELEPQFIGKNKKDIQYILWRLALREQPK